MRRGRHRQRLRRPDPVRGVEPRARRDAADRREDRDERRQPASSRSSSRSCPTPASAWRGWNSSSTTDRRASEGLPRISDARRGPEEEAWKRSARLSPTRALLPRKAGRRRGTIAAAFWPKPVIVRLSDFKSNEYRSCSAASATSPTKRTRCSASAAPRATSRRASGSASSSSARRCKKVRDEMGLTNVELMVPFVRTVGEAEAGAWSC